MPWERRTTKQGRLAGLAGQRVNLTTGGLTFPGGYDNE